MLWAMGASHLLNKVGIWYRRMMCAAGATYSYCFKTAEYLFFNTAERISETLDSDDSGFPVAYKLDLPCIRNSMMSLAQPWVLSIPDVLDLPSRPK